jgi:hypothetical protein
MKNEGNWEFCLEACISETEEGEDDVVTYLKEVDCEYGRVMKLTQDRVGWRTLILTKLEHRWS